MKIQIWYCDLCQTEFPITDVKRAQVTCTGGHPKPMNDPPFLTADHWPIGAEFRRKVREPAPKWLVLPEGQRCDPDESIRAAEELAADRQRLLNEGGWPEVL